MLTRRGFLSALLAGAAAAAGAPLASVAAPVAPAAPVAAAHVASISTGVTPPVLFGLSDWMELSGYGLGQVVDPASLGLDLETF